MKISILSGVLRLMDGSMRRVVVSLILLSMCVLLTFKSVEAESLPQALGWVKSSKGACYGYFSDQLDRHSQGLVHDQEPGYRILSHRMRVNLEKQQLELHDFWFRATSDDRHWVWGHAADGLKYFHGEMQLKDAKLSICSPLKDSWYIQAHRLRLNPQQGWGYAYGAQLVFQNVPIFYFPYLTFPLDKRRKTGFLTPSLSHRSVDGWVIQWPFYWNIAPSEDFLITSQWIQKRGWLLSGVFRYLTHHSLGTWHGIWMIHDKFFQQHEKSMVHAWPYSDIVVQRQLGRLTSSSNQRLALSLEHHSRWYPHWMLNLKLNTATDDYFYLDFFPHRDFFHNTQLLNQFDGTYEGQHWRFLAQMQFYHTLHPLHVSAVPEVYRLWPRLSLLGHFKSSHYPLYYRLKAQYTDFEHKRSWVTGAHPVTGERLYLSARIRSPQRVGYGLTTPEVVFTYTDYRLSHRLRAPHVKRFVPIFDIDSRWRFERDVTWHHGRYVQTLEPHLFYLWIPERSQYLIPLFDTTTLPIHFSHLFLENRLTGTDRLLDANQLSLGLTTRWFESKTQREVLRFSLGHTIHFHRSRVTLPSPYGRSRQGVWVAEFRERLSSYCETSGTWGWNHQDHRLQHADFKIDFHQGIDKHIVLSYDVLHPSASITTSLDALASQGVVSHLNVALWWPWSSTLHFVGHMDYNVKQHRTEQFAYALKYRSCCWSLKIGVDQNFVGLPSRSYQHSFFVKFQLKGLGES